MPSTMGSTGTLDVLLSEAEAVGDNEDGSADVIFES